MERKNTKFKKIIGSALALMVAFVTFLNFDSKVSAADVFTNPYIYKEIKKSDGTTTPTATFNYEFTPFSFNGGTTDLSMVPPIADVAVSFSSADAGTGTPIVSVKKGEPVVIPAMSGANGFKRAGEYVYTVVEKSKVFSAAPNDALSDSAAKYEIHIFIKNNGTGLELGGVTVYQLLDDEGASVTKVKIDGSENGKAMLFSSDYSKTATLSVKKEVVGDYADKLKKFSFTVNFAAAANVTGSNTYDYYLTQDGTKIAGSEGTLTVNGTGTASILLAHGQAAVFEGLPTGTKFYAVETADAKYKSEGEISSNGVVTSILEATGDLVLNINAGVKNPDTLIGEGENYALAINTEKDISVTGLIFENLPFLILIAVGIGGIGFYVTKRRRHQ
ncbi:hypothetical protein OKW22_001361 [Bacilli bacterium PM5-3]|nr:hypothetical protein [Bacilli bacterium PM5-3]